MWHAKKMHRVAQSSLRNQRNHLQERPPHRIFVAQQHWLAVIVAVVDIGVAAARVQLVPHNFQRLGQE